LFFTSATVSSRILDVLIISDNSHHPPFPSY